MMSCSLSRPLQQLAYSPLTNLLPAIVSDRSHLQNFDQSDLELVPVMRHHGSFKETIRSL